MSTEVYTCLNPHCGAIVEKGVTRTYVDSEGNLKCESCPSVVDGKVVE